MFSQTMALDLFLLFLCLLFISLPSPPQPRLMKSVFPSFVPPCQRINRRTHFPTIP
ncbi:hypothetical protein F5H01DRAFT_378819 [Linnemannia elongata]|nr:hypothetical protein F5H01DRAFT_378819 [Linnemannia elongata]